MNSLAMSPMSRLMRLILPVLLVVFALAFLFTAVAQADDCRYDDPCNTSIIPDPDPQVYEYLQAPAEQVTGPVTDFYVTDVLTTYMRLQTLAPVVVPLNPTEAEQSLVP